MPLLALNSLTMLGAEVYGRSYGGGVLKMEPREAAALPVPRVHLLREGWRRLRDHKQDLDQALREGKWAMVVERVDQALLEGAAAISRDQAAQLAQAAASLRRARLGTP